MRKSGVECILSFIVNQGQYFDNILFKTRQIKEEITDSACTYRKVAVLVKREIIKKDEDTIKPKEQDTGLKKNNDILYFNKIKKKL